MRLPIGWDHLSIQLLPSRKKVFGHVRAPGSQIVVDVTYTFKPTIGAQFLGTMSLSRTTYMAPRNSTIVESTPTSTVAPACPGVL